MTINSEILDLFFGDHASEVIDILGTMIDQLPQSDQMLIGATVHAPREYLGHRLMSGEQVSVADVD